jgi:hypothetical protein
MTPIMTKKWKCISTTPPDRWTRTAEAVISPSTAAADRARRASAGWLAATANAATSDASCRPWTTPKPRAVAKATTPATWAHSSRMIPRCRLAQTSRVSSWPCGSAPRTASMVRLMTSLAAFMAIRSAATRPA